ncbi:MAG: hypothetical protein ABF636_06390 [Acetobacter sp.]
MTTPTNWPNSERPGVPMFPERDGWHILWCNSSPSGDYFRYWHSKEELWSETRHRNLCHCLPLPKYGHDPDYVACRHQYIGPVLTPAQIAEMLAGERERVAKEIVAFEDNWMGASDGNNALQDAIRIIRNLGAAS